MNYKKPVIFKIFVGIGVLVFLLVIFLAIYNRVQDSNNGKVNIVAIPSDSKIFVDGVDKGKMGTFRLEPGTHRITVTRNGFNDAEETIEAIAGRESDVTIVLVASSQEGYKWEELNPEEVSKKEFLIGQRVVEDGKNFAEKNPIVKKVPFKNPNFRIDYSLNDKGGVDLIIKSYGIEGKNLAYAQLRQWGFDPEKFIVVFKDLSL